MTWKLLRCLLLVLAVVTATSEVWAKNWNSQPSSSSIPSSVKKKHVPQNGRFTPDIGDKYRLNYVTETFTYSCLVKTKGWQDYRTRMQLSPDKLIVFLASTPYYFELDRSTYKARHNIPPEQLTGASGLWKTFNSPASAKYFLEELNIFPNFSEIEFGVPKNIMRTLNVTDGSKQIFDMTIIPTSFSKYGKMMVMDAKMKAEVAVNGRTVLRMSSDFKVHLSTGMTVASNTKVFNGDSAKKNNADGWEKKDCEIEEQEVVASEFNEIALSLGIEANRIQTLKNPRAQAASPPSINIFESEMNGPQGTITGRVSDASSIAELQVDGRIVDIDNNGNFVASIFVPVGGASISVKAVNVTGLSSTMSVRLERAGRQETALSFARLNPLKRKATANRDSLALIVGIANYSETPAAAVYADTDAQVFADFATQTLGVPANRVKTLVNDAADEKGMLLAVKDWVARATKQGKSDIYVFFAGHGLASDDGKNMYLLPYDGEPRLLSDTAILRDRLFNDIASANPRSVTVFFDTCYSGQTRGEDMLIASRPVRIKPAKKAIPDNFTLLTAAAGDQTAKPLEEAKHGMFSYFLMKGMEGDADANKDNQITAGELHQYVQQNVMQQSAGSQRPELQGDANRVLVRFQ